MKTESLNGAWTLTFFEEIGRLPSSPQELARGDFGPTIAAEVPGNVELDLSRSGYLPEDLLYGDNILQTRRLESFQWWYAREFSTPSWASESDTMVVFEGLDCFATIWVNDVEVGRGSNALITHRFEISSALLPAGETNRLVVRIESPINAVRDLPIDGDSLALIRNESLWARKPPHAYGWDIMPRAVSAGLWRDVRLEEKPATAITDVFLDTWKIEASRAILECQLYFRSPLPFRELRARVTGRCGRSSFQREIPLLFNQVSFEIELAEPVLWWPRGYGDAALYDVVVELLHQDEVVAERRLTLGIRTVQLDRTDLHLPEQPGRFSFLVNGVPIFCRGTNWTPADPFHSRDAERIPRILALCADMECNMLRCWGGNVYEAHAFFDICDREGFLVWQDFGMACAAYPQREPFLEIMRQEAEWVVRELRQHPCIALWSGDNEVDELNLCWGKNPRDPNENRITRGVLPEVIGRFDQRRPYLPSSPFIPPAAIHLPEPNRSIPEQHLWGARRYYKTDYYKKTTALFASEVGYHGCLSPASLAKFIPAEKLWPCLENDIWLLHCTDPFPEFPSTDFVRLMNTQISEMFGEVPDNLEDFALASQITHAEAMKFFLELFRQRKGSATGVLWWNMVDGWPQNSNALVDYYFEKKPAYYVMKRAHGPLSVLIHEPAGGRMEISAVNDTLRARNVRCRIWDADTGEAVFAGEFEVGENCRHSCGFIPVPGRLQRLYLISWNADGEEGCNHYLYGEPAFNFHHFKTQWLPKIAALGGDFSAGDFC